MKIKAIERNFRKIKNEYPGLLNAAKHSKYGSLLEIEASIRKKLKALREIKSESIGDYNEVYKNYVSLLIYISEKIIDSYNQKNKTNFSFEELYREDMEQFLSSGILAVLTVTHIPKQIALEFKEKFPKNPEDEFLKARGMKRSFYLHLGDTNTGKTYDSIEALKKSKNGIYLSPLRILALEIYEKLNAEGIKCSLITGEEEIIVDGAVCTSSTIEKLNLDANYDLAVIDEIQMINDDQRGYAWTRAVLGLLCKEIHVCGAINTKHLLINLIKACNDEFILKEYMRTLPLIFENESFSLRNAERGDALVVFSKKRVLSLAHFYANIGIKASLIYGDLPPEVRKQQYSLFLTGESSILITTDAIGMGVNLPIKRIIFMDIKKYDGNTIRYLNSQEVKQIAGRAGRKGIYDKGFVKEATSEPGFIDDKLQEEDFSIKTAVLGPSDAILSVAGLPLKEKLALWITLKEENILYRKMDITEYLIILDILKPFKLNERMQWKLLKIPFDTSSEKLLNTFINFVEQVFEFKYKSLIKPECLSQELNDLEIYYQEINLFYSFSKAFTLELDLDFVKKERMKTSEKINKILVNLK